MALIKGGLTSGQAEGAIVLDLGDLERQGEAIIADAQRRAERIIADAHAQAEVEGAEMRAAAAVEGRAAGEEEGREAGEVEGRAAVIAEWTPRLEQLSAALERATGIWESRMEADLAAAGSDATQLALAVAERIVQRTIDADPAAVVDQVRAALELLIAPRSVEVRLHPDELETVRAAIPQLEERTAAASRMQLITDENVDRGGCIVRSGEGVIDARIGRQLDRVAAAMLGAARARTPEHDASAQRADHADHADFAAPADAAPNADQDDLGQAA